MSTEAMPVYGLNSPRSTVEKESEAASLCRSSKVEVDTVTISFSLSGECFDEKPFDCG